MSGFRVPRAAGKELPGVDVEHAVVLAADFDHHAAIGVVDKISLPDDSALLQRLHDRRLHMGMPRGVRLQRLVPQVVGVVDFSSVYNMTFLLMDYVYVAFSTILFDPNR